jgi:hypothetical protein
MLLIVTFEHVKASSAEKEISKEEGALPLIPSSIMLRVHIWLKLCARRRKTVSLMTASLSSIVSWEDLDSCN